MQHLRKVSFSRLKTFSHCPKQFEFKYIQEAPSIPTNLNSHFGKSLHFAAQQFVHSCLENKQFPTLGYVVEQFSNNWKESVANLQQQFGQEHLEKLIKVSAGTLMIKTAKMQMKNGPSEQSKLFGLEYWNVLGTQILEQFYAREKDSLCISGANTRIFDASFSEFDDSSWLRQYMLLNKQFVQYASYRTPLYTEKDFEFKIEEHTDTFLRGSIDRIDKEWIYDEKSNQYKENTVLIEYKTDISPHSLSQNIDQIYVYAYAMKMELDLPVSKAILSGLRTGEEVVIPIQEAKMKQTEDWLQETVVQISNTKEFIATPSFSKCKFCDFKNICPSSAQRGK